MNVHMAKNAGLVGWGGAPHDAAVVVGVNLAEELRAHAPLHPSVLGHDLFKLLSLKSPIGLVALES